MLREVQGRVDKSRCIVTGIASRNWELLRWRAFGGHSYKPPLTSARRKRGTRPGRCQFRALMRTENLGIGRAERLVRGEVPPRKNARLSPTDNNYGEVRCWTIVKFPAAFPRALGIIAMAGC